MKPKGAWEAPDHLWRGLEGLSPHVIADAGAKAARKLTDTELRVLALAACSVTFWPGLVASAGRNDQ
jgi:hypothetical protein